MRRNKIPFSLLLLLISSAGVGQVVAPFEMKDPALRGLQQKYMDDLKIVGKDIVAGDYPYPFYLSRKLDIDEQQQKVEDQHSVRFDLFNGQTVLAITGNYYAAYPSGKFSGEQRARATFLNVAMPVLKASVRRFQNNKSVQGYALEISHHILGQVMGVTVENPENLVVFLPQNAALKLLAAKDETAQQVALLEGQTLLNAEPVMIWSGGKDPISTSNQKGADLPREADLSSKPAGTENAPSSEGLTQPNAAVRSFPEPLKAKETPPVAPPRDTSPQALNALQEADEQALASMSKELDPQAHFVSIAAPTFVAFRQGIYLELSLNTTLPEWAAGSRYKLAALAFDGHIAQLIRPTLSYFKEESKFDGIGFSTTLHHPTGKGAAGDASEAVEFFFPFTSLRCYQSYDCTGQQLIDAGTVLINGERVSLDLQIAEGGSSNR